MESPFEALVQSLGLGQERFDDLFHRLPLDLDSVRADLDSYLAAIPGMKPCAAKPREANDSGDQADEGSGREIFHLLP
jgi:hypothetical protein